MISPPRPPSLREGGVCLVGAALLIGCNDEPTARFELEKQGFSVIVLTRTDKRGVWDFRANKTTELAVCSGTVTVKRELGKTSTSSTSTCQPDEEACNPKHAAHCLALGERYRSDDRAKANQFFDKACEGGEAVACNALGFSYEKGLGVTADAKRARALYESGCQLGEASACRNTGVLRRDGVGGDADPAAAAALFDKACEGGDAPGCFEAGVAHAGGLGVEKSYKRAAAAFEKACTGKVDEACALLGAVLVEGGDGLEKNEARGISLLIDGCKKDDAQACGNLAVLSSRKVIDDPTAEKRAVWAEKACTGKYAGG
ncbi:MAG: sel1 repeat family protein, partial [Myxococcales bacterium]|nr:sel1 repeat family protein [Myxococcales bacterium]